MAQRDFWRGFNTAIAIFAGLALFCYIETYLCSSNLSVCSPPYSYIYPGGVVLATMLLVFCHNRLTAVRNHLQQKHQLRIVKDIAKALYPKNGKLCVRFLETRQHVGANFVGVSWVAGVGSMRTGQGNTMSIQTKTPALTRGKALVELHKTLAKKLVEFTAEMRATTEWAH